VAGSYVEEAPSSLITSNPDFFKQFTLVLASQVNQLLAAPLQAAALASVPAVRLATSPLACGPIFLPACRPACPPASHGVPAP
jgi:hypothetical protein